MLRMIVIGVWTCAVTVASTYGVAYWKSHRAATATQDAHVEKLEVRKVKPITVPIISEGTLKGYISAEFSYVIDVSGREHGSLDPDSYFMDEAFRRIYSDNTLDFRHIEKFDLNSLTKELTQRLNDRMGANLVKETLVKSFAFVPKEDIPH
jgi:hypothetical protein